MLGRNLADPLLVGGGTDDLHGGIRRPHCQWAAELMLMVGEMLVTHCQWAAEPTLVGAESGGPIASGRRNEGLVWLVGAESGGPIASVRRNRTPFGFLKFLKGRGGGIWS